MAAGLPGVGLSGTFFIVSALVAVPLELIRTLRGQGSFARWSEVLRHFALAITMIAGLLLSYAALQFALAHFANVRSFLTQGILVAEHGDGKVVRTMPVLPVLATLGLVACVTSLAKGAQLFSIASRRRALMKRG
jgi:hypothetical protein